MISPRLTLRRPPNDSNVASCPSLKLRKRDTLRIAVELLVSFLWPHAILRRTLFSFLVIAPALAVRSATRHIPAMTETVAFLLKDLVLLVVSVYLLRQDVIRVAVATEQRGESYANTSS
jgi:hypothetical protein